MTLTCTTQTLHPRLPARLEHKKLGTLADQLRRGDRPIRHVQAQTCDARL